MKKDFISRRPSGSEKKNEPKVIGKVLIEYFQSDKPLAVEFRHWKASNEAAKANEEQTEQLFESIFPCTELDVNLKLLKLQPGRMRENEFLPGMLTRYGENQYCFVQNASSGRKMVITRNPHVYVGKYVNVTKSGNGSLYPTLNRPRYTESFTFKDFCRKAAEELLMVASLVENE